MKNSINELSNLQYYMPTKNKNISLGYFFVFLKCFTFNFLAREQGFEPRLTGPEPVVLPLDDSRKIFNLLPSHQKFLIHHLKYLHLDEYCF